MPTANALRNNCMHETQAGKLLLISSLEPCQIGESWQSGEQLPLHTTVMPWFTGVSQPVMQNSLINICAETAPINAVSDEQALFGPNQDVRVTKLARMSGLIALHRKILWIIERSGGVIESDWIGDEYSPHISFLGKTSLKAGQTIELKTLELIGKYLDGSKWVEDIYRFAGNKSQA